MSAEALRRATDAILRHTGIRVPEYRWPVIEGELRRLGGAADIADALRRVEADPELRGELLRTVAVPETYLFRHPGHFLALAELARGRREAGRPCRVLSAGCSSGEEAWSAGAVLASVYLPGRDFAVEAWDLDPKRLAFAEAGCYRSWSVRGGLLGYAGHFVACGDEWRVGERLRPFVRFSVQNLMLPPAPGPLFDAILFRNVAIYWEPETAERVVQQLVARLAPDGLFLPGPSDPVRFPSEQWTTERCGDAATHARRPEAAAPAPSRPCASGAPKLKPSAPPRARAAVPSSPQPDAGWLQSAAAHADQGRYREALDVLCAQPGPLPGAGRLLMGIVMLSLDRPDEALAWVRQAVFLEPDAAGSRQWLALALERLGRTDEAARERRNAEDLENDAD